jgi:hypothetical protein
MLGKYDHWILQFDFRNLSEFAVKMRYPGDELIPSIEEIEIYIQLCTNIRNYILSKIVR